MIQFRQKEFWGAALSTLGHVGNAAMIGGTVYGVKQGKDQQREMERANEEQAELIKEQNRKLDKIAERAKSDPQSAVSAAESMKSYNAQKGFSASVPVKVWNTVRGMTQEAWKNKAVRDHVKTGVVSGVALGAGGVTAGAIISHDAKKHGISFQPQQSELRTYAAKSIMQGVGKVVKKHGMTGGMFLMGSAPLLAQYAAEKQQLKDQAAATQQQQQQRQYANPAKYLVKSAKWIGNTIKNPGNMSWLGNQEGTASTLRNGWNSFKKHPGNSTLSWINKNVAFAGGNRATQQYAKDVVAGSGKYGDNYMKQVGGFMQKHKKTALAAGIPVGFAVMSGTWDAGEKLTKRAAKTINPNITAYQESKEQGIS